MAKNYYTILFNAFNNLLMPESKSSFKNLRNSNFQQFIESHHMFMNSNCYPELEMRSLQYKVETRTERWERGARLAQSQFVKYGPVRDCQSVQSPNRSVNSLIASSNQFYVVGIKCSQVVKSRSLITVSVANVNCLSPVTLALNNKHSGSMAIADRGKKEKITMEI